MSYVVECVESNFRYFVGSYAECNKFINREFASEDRHLYTVRKHY